MEAKYDIYETPAVNAEGQKKWHVRVITDGTVESDEIARKIQLSSSLTIGDVEAVLSGLSHYVTDLLKQGSRVHIKGLGYFQITLKCDTNEPGKKIRSESVHFKSVSFRPESKLKKELKGIRFIRTQRKSHSVKLSGDAVCKLLVKYFKASDYITRMEFQQLCGFTQITAIRRLNHLVEEGKLIKKGVKRHPIYEPVHEKLNDIVNQNI